MRPRYPRLLHDSLTVSATTFPHKTAVIDGKRHLTYSDLHDQALRLAAALQARGVRRGDRVALYMENSLEAVVGIYSALYAGAAFMVVNPQTKEDKLEYVLADSGAKAVFSEGRLARLVAQVMSGAPAAAGERVLVHADTKAAELTQAGSAPGFVEVSLSEADGAPTDLAPPGTIPLDLAALVYTSGSTGNRS